MENFLSNTRDTVLTAPRLEHLLSLLAAYLFLLSWNGYIYGHGDMIELLPYAKWLTDSTLYSKDFFIQHISAQSINERYILAYFFSLFGKWMPQAALVLHLICGLFLLEGLFRVAQIFIRSRGLIWLAILIPFIPLMNWNLGGNEMYIPLITSSTVAKAFGIWAIYFFLKKDGFKINNWNVYILLSIATFIQPLVGLQLFLMMTGARMLIVVFSGEIEWKTFLPVLFYVLTGGVWVFWLQRDFAEGGIDNRLFFDFLEFRLPHHFIPTYFSKKAAVVLLPLFAWSLFFYFKKNKTVFWMFVLTLLGMLIYTIGVEFLENSTIVSSQWFKTTIWLKSLSVIALFSFLENKIPVLQKEFFQKNCTWGLRIMGVISIAIILNPISIFKNKPYDFFFLNKKNAEIEIAEIAKATTPKDALFIIPMNHTHFKNYSERSTYIDYKAVIHRKSIIPIWYKKIQEIYNVNIETRQSGQDNVMVGNQNFKKLAMEDLRRFSQKGIQYLLTFKEVDLPLERVGENPNFVIYKLP
ncbi:MAG: DUF6798 domain-containing protein [Saprospiraceae bacterium]